jgi:hypothetical protein
LVKPVAPVREHYMRRIVLSTRESATRKIIQANIDRFNLLLKTITDPTKRAMVIRLLAEEEAKRVPGREEKKA